MKAESTIMRVIFAIIMAMCALFLSYVSTNLNVAVSGEKAILKYWRVFTDWIRSGGDELSPSNDVVFINVSNDKQLVDVSDAFGIPIGNAAITDRDKLVKLLDMIDSSRTYQYVMMDVFFEEGFKTQSDSALFSLMDRMDRIVIAKHKDSNLEEGVPYSKAAFADYNTSINENDFTKYRLYWKDGRSLPLKAYEDLTGNTIRRKGLWFSDKGSLSRKVVFPKMYVRADFPYRADGQKAYLNLGADILDYSEEQEWSEFFSYKFIVIGSFTEDDIHTTYAGDLPGCLINYNVFLSLMKGQHKIPLTLIIIYFLIFFAMAYMLLIKVRGGIQPFGWMCAKLFVMYSVILAIVCIFVFMIWGQAHDIFVTSTFFSIVDTMCRRLMKKI